MAETKNFKLVESRSGNKAFYVQYIRDGCLYTKNGVSRKEGFQYYKCTGKSEKKEKCKVTGKIINEEFIRINPTTVLHNHEHHSLDSRCKEIASEIEREATNTSGNIGEIFCKHTKE